MVLMEGDWVIFTNKDEFTRCPRLKIGSIYKVAQASEANMVWLVGDHKWMYHVSRFTKVSPADFSKVERVVYGV